MMAMSDPITILRDEYGAHTIKGIGIDREWLSNVLYALGELNPRYAVPAIPYQVLHCNAGMFQHSIIIGLVTDDELIEICFEYPEYT